jgi:SAM-dependent methyltransferase
VPFSSLEGAERGERIDQYYIRRFIDASADDVRGRVLEMRDSRYTRQFGGARVTQADVLDNNQTNRQATVNADLCKAHEIATHTYDCLIFVHSLQLIYDVRAALAECVRILKPGGVLLATVPCAGRVATRGGLDSDYWRFTAASARHLVAECFGIERIQVHSRGNVLVMIAFLYGLASRELTTQELETDDPYFPLLVTIRAQAPVDEANRDSGPDESGAVLR